MEHEPDIYALEEEHQTFRNDLASIAKDGRRKWVYAHQPSGKFYNARQVVGYFLLTFLFIAPFLRFQSNPVFLFNILERKFIIFGVVFWPQDFYLVVLLLLTFILSIAVFTSILGRIWCGWACPQTIFLEFVFRRIEFLIEGNAREQINLDKSPINTNKVFKKTLKHGIFLVLSWIICNLFLAYIIGTDVLWDIITDPPQQHIAGLTVMFIVSGLFYGIFARFREQACVVACPYGRFQSALVDPDTIAVTYDFERGEPRRKPSKADKTGNLVEPRGDCIDCHQCVVVCPTGIDIRNGIQLECVNCTACIDACDTVMKKIKKPIGLIRYTSYNAVKTGIVHHFSARVKAYTAVWLVLCCIVAALFIRRPDMEIIILRQPGTLFQTMGNDKIANFYTLQLINKTFAAKNVELQLVEPTNGTITPLSNFSIVEPQNVLHGRFFVALNQKGIRSSSNKLHFRLVANGVPVKDLTVSFLSP